MVAVARGAGKLTKRRTADSDASTEWTIVQAKMNDAWAAVRLGYVEMCAVWAEAAEASRMARLGRAQAKRDVPEKARALRLALAELSLIHI